MRARILSSTPDHIALVAQAIQHDEVVGMPTETVYGLAGGAFQPEALARIFETKERPTFDPLIVHVGTEARNLKELEKLRLVNISLLSPIAYQRIELLIERFWPGPLTLVLPKQDAVPDLATSGLPSVALRMPAHPVAQALIAAAGTPLAAPSANRFGRISPTTAQAVADELGDRIDWIINGGHCQVGVESTVLRIEVDGRLTLLRPGGIARDQIEKIGPWTVEIEQPSSNPIAAGMLAPGMLDSHYAPSKPMFMLPATIPHLEAQHWEEIVQRAAGAQHLGFLLQKDEDPQIDERIVHHLLTPGGAAHHPRITALCLSSNGDLHEAARTLFSKMRALDTSDAQVIFAEPCASIHGLGHAIADRLGRACQNSIQ